MVAINLTERDAAALLAVLHKVIDKGRIAMLGERKIVPTYDEVMAAMKAANQINEANKTNK